MTRFVSVAWSGQDLELWKERTHHGCIVGNTMKIKPKIVMNTNVLVTCSLAEKLAVLATEDYILPRVQHASQERFNVVLAQVHEVPAMPGDALLP
ncbi:MAG: hypothetical protein ACI9I0_002517 [Rhodoferax sp.]|jgi:hypothetical protein